MKTILRSIVADILEALGFATLQEWVDVQERLYGLTEEIACEREKTNDFREFAERMFIERNVERDRSKRLREFVVEVKVNTHPNAAKHMGAPLYDLATRVLAETRESEAE